MVNLGPNPKPSFLPPPPLQAKESMAELERLLRACPGHPEAAPLLAHLYALSGSLGGEAAEGKVRLLLEGCKVRGDWDLSFYTGHIHILFPFGVVCARMRT